MEDDPDWFGIISRRTRNARVYYLKDQAYVNKIQDFPPGYFDLISIDGSQRLACFDMAEPYLKPGGMLLIDNTDKDRITRGDLYQIDSRLADHSKYRIHRFTGWTHGNFFSQETTVCVLDAAATSSAGNSN